MKIAIKAAELQQQLADPSIEKRDVAEAELIKLGVIALDYLDPVTDDSPPDTIERLNRIRKALETIVVEDAVKLKLKRKNSTWRSKTRRSGKL